MSSPIITIIKKGGKGKDQYIITLEFIGLPSGRIIEVVDIKKVDLHLYHHNVITEKIMLLRDYPEEPAHHYVVADNEPMMVDA